VEGGVTGIKRYLGGRDNKGLTRLIMNAGRRVRGEGKSKG